MPEPNRIKLKLRFFQRRHVLSLSGAAIFLILFLSSQTTYFLFLLLFLTSLTPKPDRTKPKPNSIGRSGVLSLQVGFGVEYIKIESLESVQRQPYPPFMLKPKFSVWCKNCLQHRSSTRTSSDEEQVEAAAKIKFLPSTPLVKPYSSSSGSETKPMEPESTPVKATQARSFTMKKKKRPNSETETTPSKRVKDEVQDLVPHSMLRNLALESQTQVFNPNLQQEFGNLF
nr:uncharacterized protein LOC112029331 isoform X2 [Quercus suber]